MLSGALLPWRRLTVVELFNLESRLISGEFYPLFASFVNPLSV